MRAVPLVILFITLLITAAVAPVATAERPRGMAFNGQVSADVRGAATAVSLDGPGRWAAVSVADAGLVLPDEQDLFVFDLASEARAWAAIDSDLVNEGGRLVAVANGTSGSTGDWLVLVNQTSSVLTTYRTSGFGKGNVLGSPMWQFNPQSSDTNGIVISRDGSLIAMATGATLQNKSIILLRNDFNQQTFKVLFRASGNNTQFQDVSRFTSIAMSTNATLPSLPDTERTAYMIVGAQTTGTGGIGGAVYVYETVFTSLDNPQTNQVMLLSNLNSPVTHVAMTADGEYAVAGTQEGQVFLISVSEALQRRGVSQIVSQLRPTQHSAGSAIRALDISDQGGEFFAAGTEAGEVILFRNQRNPFGSDGAVAVEIGEANVALADCGAARAAGPIRSLDMSGFGQQMVVGAQNALLGFDAAAYARFLRPAPFEPGWCIPMAQSDVKDGVFADISADGFHVFAASNTRVFGYKNFFCVKVEPVGSARQVGFPGQRIQWSIRVTNGGSMFDRVNLSASGSLTPGWEFQLSNRSLLLAPGKSQVVLLNVTSPQDLQPGNFTIDVSAEPERSQAFDSTRKCSNNDLTEQLRLDLGHLRRVELVPPEGTLIANAGSPNTFPITLRNLGNAADRFRVFAQIPEPQDQFKSPGSDWTIRTDPAVVEVPANGQGVVNLVVAPLAQRGDQATIQIDVVPEVPSPDGQFVGDSKQVVVAVEPTFNGDIALVEARDHQAEPGQSIFINFTVKNLGNTRDIFKVQNRTDPANAPGWRLTLSDERFELRQQNQQKVVRLTVFAQQGLQPGESVRITVDIFSEGLARATGSDGQVDSQAVSVTVVPRQQRGLPMAAEPLLILGVLGAAVLLRRRD